MGDSQAIQRDTTHKRDRESPTSPHSAPARKRNNMDSNQRELLTAIQEMKDDIRKDMIDMKEFFNDRVDKMAKYMETKLQEWESEKAVLVRHQLELETKIELMERRQKRANVIITGLTTNNQPAKQCVEQLLRDKIDNNITVTDAFPIKTKGGVKILATLSSTESKLMIMRNKGKLSSSGNSPNIFVSDDLTKKEEAIQYQAREFARQMKAQKKDAKVAYKKVYVDNILHVWDEDTKTFINKKN